MNYENDIKIDETSLDVEWLQQPSLMMKYAEQVSRAQADTEIMKQDLDILKAEIDKKIRANPEKYEIAKITESVILNTIIQQKEYQEANIEYIEAMYELNMTKNAVKAIDGKKTSLENLVKLHGQQYFAGPSVPRDLSKEWKEKEKTKNSNKKIKIRTRNK